MLQLGLLTQQLLELIVLTPC